MEQWEPGELRGSRRVLREAGGAIPPAYSPMPKRRQTIFSVILEFDVVDGNEIAFVELWEQTTQIIYQHFGSLGSRLHRDCTGKFIAYAQWPSIDVYEDDHLWPRGAAAEVRERMRSILKSGKPKVLFKMDLISDLLKEEVYLPS